ncbi:hypothetical protein GFK26_11020 [Variovorax paradoxus]|uniref:Uncharacterized protein n=1 Tax=Variovorax paradoxus TaxID=34073 RepID=A0A5Q0M3X2_VARPD|nr:hypothetical protein [Variovorax paradoxus]QFZ83254.1 hypothetical protein GFK26_11020 [Variovorax paradoxus]
MPEPTFAQVSLLDSKTVLAHAVEDFYTRYKTSAELDGTSEEALALLDAGRILIELRCEEYLDGIGQSNQAAGHVRQQTNLLGGVSSALMGITGNSAKQIAGVASAFSFAGASMDAYSTAYLFADAGTSIVKLVHASQELFMREVNNGLQGTVLDHMNAMHILLGYQSICRPAKIRALVNDALSKAQVVAEIAPDHGADLEVLGVLAQLERELGKPVSESDAIRIYGRFLKPEDGNLTLASGVALDTARIAGLSTLFLPLGLKNSKVASRWKSALASTAPPASSTPLQQATAPAKASADAKLRDAENKSAAANRAGAFDAARKTSTIIETMRRALAEVRGGGDLEKAKSLVAQAKSAAVTAKALPDLNSPDPSVAKSAKEAVNAIETTAAATATVVDKAISTRDGNREPRPRMNQFSLPIIGISR